MSKPNINITAIVAQVQAAVQAHESNFAIKRKQSETIYFHHINEQFIIAKNLKVGDYINMWSQELDMESNSHGEAEFDKDYRTKQKTIFKVTNKVGDIGVYYKQVLISGKLESTEHSIIDAFQGGGDAPYYIDLVGFQIDEGFLESQILDTPFVPYAGFREKLDEENARRKANAANKISMSDFSDIQAFCKTHSAGGTFYSGRGATYDIKPFTAPPKVLKATNDQFIDSAYDTYNGWAHKKFIVGIRTDSKGKAEAFNCSVRDVYRGIIPTLYNQPFQKAKKGLE